MHLRRTLSAALVASTLFFAPAALAEPPVVTIEGLSTARAAALEHALVPALARARAGKLSVAVAGDRATVTFAPTEGTILTRTLVLGGDETERTRSVVWLAENLSRDEAAELALPSAVPSAPTAEPPPTEPPPPPKEPAPKVVVAPSPPPPAKTTAPPVRPRGPCDDPMPWHPASFAIVSPLAYPAVPSRTNVAIALGYGQFGAVDGAAIGLFNHVRCDVHGVSIASVVGLTGRDVHGAAIGIANVVGGDVHGTGISSSIGLYRGDIEGSAIGIVNIVEGKSRGLLVAGGINAHRGALEGASIGVVNATPNDVEGTQIGVVDVARKVRGLQLGVVNIAEEADAAVGVVSISWARPFRPTVRSTIMRPVAGGMLFEGGRTFSEISATYSRRLGADRDRFALSIDVGAHVLANDDRGLLLDAAVGMDNAIGPDVADDDGAATGRLEARLGYRVVPRFAPQLVAGAMLMPKTIANPVRIVPEFGVALTF